MKTTLSATLVIAALLVPATPRADLKRLRPSSAVAVGIKASQRCENRGADAAAKELARTAQVTAETIATDHNGFYTRVNPAELRRYEPSIDISRTRAARRHEPYVARAHGTRDSYTLTVEATDGNRFTIGRDSASEIVSTSRICGRRDAW